MTTPEPTTDDRISRLPVWVQEHIAGLNSRISSLNSALDEAQAALQADPGDSNVFAEVGDVSRPLGKDVTVVFGTGPDSFTVTLEDGALRIDAARDVAVEPVAAYEVAVRMREPK